MPGKTIFWYLFRQNLKVVLLALLLLTMVAALGQFADASRYLRDGSNQTALDILTVALLRTPALFLPILPHVILISAAVTVHRLGRRLEPAIILQSGISSVRLLLPFAFCGAVIGLVYVLAINPLASLGYSTAHEILRKPAQAAAVRPVRDAPRQIVIQGETGLQYVFIRNLVADGPLLTGLTVFRMDARHRLIDRLDADRAEWTAAGWELSGARLRNGPAATDAEAAYRFDLDPDLLDRKIEGRFASPVYSLPDQIAYAAAIGAASYALQVQWHGLLALPALLGAIAFLGGALVLRPLFRGEWKRDVVVVLAAAFLVYTLATVCDALGTSGSVPAVVTSWAVPALCLLVGLAVILLKKVRH